MLRAVMLAAVVLGLCAAAAPPTDAPPDPCAALQICDDGDDCKSADWPPPAQALTLQAIDGVQLAHDDCDDGNACTPELSAGHAVDLAAQACRVCKLCDDGNACIDDVAEVHEASPAAAVRTPSLSLLFPSCDGGDTCTGPRVTPWRLLAGSGATVLRC